MIDAEKLDVQGNIQEAIRLHEAGGEETSPSVPRRPKADSTLFFSKISSAPQPCSANSPTPTGLTMLSHKSYTVWLYSTCSKFTPTSTLFTYSRSHVLQTRLGHRIFALSCATLQNTRSLQLRGRRVSRVISRVRERWHRKRRTGAGYIRTGEYI